MLITKTEDISLWMQPALCSVCCPELFYCDLFACSFSIPATFLSLLSVLAISTRLKANHAYDTQKQKYFTNFSKNRNLFPVGPRCGQSVCSKYAVRGIRIIKHKRRKQRIFLKKCRNSPSAAGSRRNVYTGNCDGKCRTWSPTAQEH